MAYDENRQAEGYNNTAVQEKLAYWWSTLRPEDRRRMLAAVKAKPDSSNLEWEEQPRPIRRQLFNAGVAMVRMTKDFPR